MKIVEVNDKKTDLLFLDVVKVIYKNDKNYIRPLDSQIREIFDPAIERA